MKNNRIKAESIFINNSTGNVELKNTTHFSNEWTSETDDQIFASLMKNKGIGYINDLYIEVNQIQSPNDEYKQILKFLKMYKELYALKNNLNIEDLNIQFINYGKTELVFVMTDKDENNVTLLVKQPAVEFGQVKKEADNLVALQKIDANVIAPIDYFAYGDYELYVTPYINQARCVASYRSWGMYVPEPVYRFESFTKEQEDVVCICMIAKLISYYDFENNEGICSCKLGGGDFMLPKNWETKEPLIETTLDNLYFIAARNKIKCTFHEYLDLIKKEFSIRTIDKNQSFIINDRARVPITGKNIEKGIIVAKKIISNRKNSPKLTLAKK